MFLTACRDMVTSDIGALPHLFFSSEGEAMSLTRLVPSCLVLPYLILRVLSYRGLYLVLCPLLRLVLSCVLSCVLACALSCILPCLVLCLRS